MDAIVRCDHGDACAGTREGSGDCVTDAAAGSGDDDGLAAEVEENHEAPKGLIDGGDSVPGFGRQYEAVPVSLKSYILQLFALTRAMHYRRLANGKAIIEAEPVPRL